MVALNINRKSRLIAEITRNIRSVFASQPKPVEDREALDIFSPHKPWPKQAAFLNLDCTEAFYGGAAGGGKSDTLLMAALQYVDVPGYSALILRRDFARLALAGSIMDRAKAWLYNSSAKWNEQRKTFTFPSGASLQFGYIDNPDDRYRYASAEYQFIGWDELTEFNLTEDENNPYTFMFSRLRKVEALPVPLRVRSASNPGNIGHAWVKRRFIPSDSIYLEGNEHVIKGPEGRMFVPSLVQDNPAMSADRYLASLAHLPPITRARLMAGDWNVSESLQIPMEWLLRYSTQGEMLVPFNRDGSKGQPIHEVQCKRFATIDTAGTSRDKAEESRGKAASWSVIGIWDYERARDLLYLRHLWRGRVGWSELKTRVPEVLNAWRVRDVRIENAPVGPSLAEELRAFQLQMVGPMLPGMADGYRGAKLERAIAARLISRLEDGKLLIPVDAPWVPDYVRELTEWSGSAEEVCDQIDVSSYASYEAMQQSSREWYGSNNPAFAR